MICRQASAKFHQPSSRIRPVSRQRDKVNGPSRPRVGACHRSSASSRQSLGNESNNRLIEIAEFPRSRARRSSSLSAIRASTWLRACRVEHLKTRLAQRLGPVHGRVGVSKDGFRLLVPTPPRPLKLLNAIPCHGGEHLFHQNDGGTKASSCGPQPVWHRSDLISRCQQCKIRSPPRTRRR